jgi:hypothetical protein
MAVVPSSMMSRFASLLACSLSYPITSPRQAGMLSRLEDLHDVRMLQACHRFRFYQETPRPAPA